MSTLILSQRCSWFLQINCTLSNVESLCSVLLRLKKQHILPDDCLSFFQDQGAPVAPGPDGRSSSPEAATAEAVEAKGTATTSTATPAAPRAPAAAAMEGPHSRGSQTGPSPTPATASAAPSLGATLAALLHTVFMKHLGASRFIKAATALRQTEVLGLGAYHPALRAEVDAFKVGYQHASGCASSCFCLLSSSFFLLLYSFKGVGSKSHARSIT